MMEQPQPRQANLPLAAKKVIAAGHNLVDVGAEIKLLENNPFLTSAQAILDSLNALTRNVEQIATNIQEMKSDIRELKTGMARLETRMERFEGRMESFEGRMERLEARADAGDEIDRSRLWNGLSSDLAHPIQPLYSRLTTEVLPDFPKTRGDFDRLSKGKVVEFLKLLGFSNDTSLDKKLRLLKMASGITM
ncbi:hypothetical protein F5Y07DRAFT_382920 [Xylaria sp. FL0933]|nr:hypothetical protein F5Y07DRAFT_382920 [Xylaria sp. FL0933]